MKKEKILSVRKKLRIKESTKINPKIPNMTNPPFTTQERRGEIQRKTKRSN
jgi:hypothetical protein